MGHGFVCEGDNFDIYTSEKGFEFFGFSIQPEDPVFITTEEAQQMINALQKEIDNG